MSDDHLKGEVSISAELTPTGVKAGAKSRFISAIDHFFGNAVDLLNPKLEGITQRERARTAQDVKLIEAAGDKRVQMLDQDTDYEALVLQQQLKTSSRRIENKAHTVRLAIEDLRTTPPTEEQNQTGTEELDPDFLNRFERYAEDATTEQLRERWGRVLASEIRAPGTFSAKVMRIVDELDPTTAASFESLCQFRIGNVVPKILSGNLPFSEEKRLETADLILNPDGGHMRLSTQATMFSGNEIRLIQFPTAAIGMDMDVGVNLPYSTEAKALISHENKPAVPVYILTSAAEAIASAIIPNNPNSLVRSLCEAMSAELGTVDVKLFDKAPDGQFLLSDTYQTGMRIVSSGNAV